MEIVKNGLFVIPLYHGTSGLFINSIKQHGLGAVDPLIQLEAKEFMNELFELAEKQKWNDERWLEMRNRIEPIVFQQKVEGGYNFRHGGTYLAAFPQVAEKYALDNCFGCEYLTYLRALLAILVSRKVSGLKDRFLDRPVLKKWENPHDPYFIKVENVKVENVETEAGEDIESHIQEIARLMKYGFCGPHAFKLKNPISPENLTIKKLGSYDLETGELVQNA